MAASRAAELTEAYRILGDAGRRAEYDAQRASAPGAPAPPPTAPAAAAPPASQPPPPQPEAAARSAAAAAAAAGAPQFKQERASRDTFVRKATVERFRQALEGAGESYEEAKAAGFDLAFVPKSKLFGRSKNPRVLGRFVGAVDADAIADTWARAAKWNSSNDEVCVFLMASDVAPARLLAAAVAEQRRKPAKGGKVILIPLDARNWDAHVPTDAPPLAKAVISRLKSGG